MPVHKRLNIRPVYVFWWSLKTGDWGQVSTNYNKLFKLPAQQVQRQYTEEKIRYPHGKYGIERRFSSEGSRELHSHDIGSTDNNTYGQVQATTAPNLAAGYTYTNDGENKTRKRLCCTPVLFYIIEVKRFAAAQFFSLI